MAAKTSDWRPGPTVCRCCLAEGCYKDISTEYFWMGKREVYAEMLAETFDLSIAYSQSGGPNSNSRLICEPCISRLRDAADFKRQVVECEKMFLQHLDPSSSSLSAIEITAEEVEEEKELKIEQVKEEKLGSDEDFDDGPHFGDDDDDDLDDQPLTKLASKLPKKESVDLLDLIDNAKVAEKRKSTVKVKATPIKKVKLKKETKASASKAKPEKKKKDLDPYLIARRNAEIVVKFATAYPFRLPEDALVCVYCCESYDDPSQYRKHMDTEHQTFKLRMAFIHCSEGYIKVDCTDLRCRICSQKFETIDDVANHLKDAHQADIDLNYEIETVLVSRTLKERRNAEVVLQYSTVYPFRLRGKYLLCVYCCEEYAEPAVYRQHMDEMHKTFSLSTAFAHCGKGKEYLKVDCTNLRCRLCAEPFNTIEEIATHINNFHPNDKLDTEFEIGLQPYRIDKDKWLCFLCDMKFPTITKLCRHTTSHYQKFTCECCGRSYMTNEALKYHIRCSHSAKPQCRKCWQEFPSIETKREHIRRSKSCWPFCCVECGERFMSWECKQKHLVGAHGQPKATYVCPECGEVFEKRKIFYVHFKVSHTDENYICSCCGMKCGSKLQLDDHRIVHTGEKQFECSVCKKSFTRKRSLTQHMWIHSETKRFSCTICAKQFAQKVSLKGHMKSHHPEISTDF
ncbi:unnamed protein product [Parnassius mnemosyne]|uniref:Uncharacterized protein n=2 Tax=Parnassius mnemosyne TaxID=213953 RepID=A0AAV1KWV7_9NEOP